MNVIAFIPPISVAQALIMTMKGCLKLMSVDFLVMQPRSRLPVNMLNKFDDGSRTWLLIHENDNSDQFLVHMNHFYPVGHTRP